MRKEAPSSFCTHLLPCPTARGLRQPVPPRGGEACSFATRRAMHQHGCAPESGGPFRKRPCIERVDAPLPARRLTEAYPLRYGEGGQRRRGGCSGTRMPGSEGMILWMPDSLRPPPAACSAQAWHPVVQAPGSGAQTPAAKLEGTRGDAGGSAERCAGTLLSRIPEMNQECPRWCSLRPFEEPGGTHAAADAHSDKPQASLAALHLLE